MSGTKGAPLYLDPYPWDLEIRPKVVAEAIRFAQAHGWVAGQKGPPIYIGYHDQQFIMLPDKVTTTWEYLQGL